MQVGEASVGRAKTILAQASLEVIKQVEQGEISVNAAYEEIKEKAPAKTKSIFAHAEKHCEAAKRELDKIKDMDPTLQPELRKIIKYCQNRIELNKPTK